MSRGPSTFRRVTAAVKAVVAAGVEVARVEVGKDTIVIVTGKATKQQPVNELDQELAEFEARHGQG